MARAGCYYGAPFKGSREVMQVSPLSPTIFNIVVDTAIQHWEMVVVGEDAGPEGFWRAVQNLFALFCAEDRLLSSPQPARLQEVLDALTVLFDRLGLRTNVNNIVVVVFNHVAPWASNWINPTPVG